MKHNTVRNIVTILVWIILTAVLLNFAITIGKFTFLPKAEITKRITVCSAAIAVTSFALNMIKFGSAANTPLDHMVKLSLDVGIISAIWCLYFNYIPQNTIVAAILWIFTAIATIYAAGIIVAYIVALADYILEKTN